jgi:catechol 2,3-dioxygenase-like lactoylglutathione lyase family enzyme
MIKGIHHTGLSVANLDRSIEFYTTGGSFAVRDRFTVSDSAHARMVLGVADAACEVALLKGHTGYLELLKFRTPGARPEGHAPQVHHAGIRHVCVIAQDVMPAYANLVRAGAGTHAPPSGLGTGALYAYLRDPEANILELEGAPWAHGLEHPPWYAHTAIVTPDIPRLAVFYELVTGVGVHSTGSFGPGKRFDVVAGMTGIVFDGAWLRCGTGQIEFWHYRIPETLPAGPHDVSSLGWSHLCFESDDVDADHARLSAEGVPFMSAPVTNHLARFVYGCDPDGNVFELMTPLPVHADLSVDALEGRDVPRLVMEMAAGHYQAGSAPAADVANPT